MPLSCYVPARLIILIGLFLVGSSLCGQFVIDDLLEDFKISNVRYLSSNGEDLLLAATPKIREAIQAGVYTIDATSGAITLLQQTAEAPRSSQNKRPLLVQGFALGGDGKYLQNVGFFKIGSGWSHKAFVGRGEQLLAEAAVPSALEKGRGYVPIGSYASGEGRFTTVGFTYNLDDSPYGDILVEGLSVKGKARWRKTIGIKGKSQRPRYAMGTPEGTYVGFSHGGEAMAVLYDDEGEITLAYRSDKYAAVSRIARTSDQVYFAGSGNKDDRIVIEQTDRDGKVQWTASFDDAAGKPDRLYDVAATDDLVAVLYGTKAKKGYDLMMARLDVATGEVIAKQMVSSTTKETFQGELLPRNFLRVAGGRLFGLFCVKDKIVPGAAHLHLVELDDELKIVDEQRLPGSKTARNAPHAVVVHGDALYILSQFTTGFGVPNLQYGNDARLYRVKL